MSGSITAIVLSVPPNRGSQTALRATRVVATSTATRLSPDLANMGRLSASCSTITTLLSTRSPKISTRPANVIRFSVRPSGRNRAMDSAKATATLKSTTDAARTLLSMNSNTRITSTSPNPPRHSRSRSCARTDSVRSSATSSRTPSGSEGRNSARRSWMVSATAIM